MPTSKVEGNRGKDGSLTRFTEAMREICKLVPNFTDGLGLESSKADVLATKYYKHFIGLIRFRHYAEEYLENPLPEEVTIGRYYRCTAHAEHGLPVLTLPPSRANPLEVLHILAHYVQPPGTPWHRGEFGSIFLDFVERSFDADIKRQAKDIMFEKRLPTFAKTEASRLKQSEAYHTKKVGQIPQGLVGILADIQEIRS